MPSLLIADHPSILAAAPMAILLWWFLGPAVLRLIKASIIALAAVGLFLWATFKLLRRLTFGPKV